MPFLFLFFVLMVITIFYSINYQYKAYVLCFSSIILIGTLSLAVAMFSLIFTIINFYLGILMEKAVNRNAIKNKVFWFSIFLDVGILAFFKYLNPYFESINAQFSSGIYVHYSFQEIMVPFGISYYVFQSLGYLIRINRGSEKAQRDFANFAAYLLFFPKFLSGPVERSNRFFPQLNRPGKLNRNEANEGARLFLWGLFKKIVIADSLHGIISQVYGNVHQYTGMVLIVILIVQTIYIYCDFSGYSDIVLGLAKFFGINLIDNFNRPFLSRNVSEFWRRWHISLSSWCNDFIYNPFIVKFRRFGNRAVIWGIFLTFFIVGIWHGANLTFVILGVLQGMAIVYEFYTKRTRLKIASRFPKSAVNTVSRIIVFIFMSFSMVFFFANSVEDAWYLISHIFSGRGANFEIFSFSNQPHFLFALLFFTVLFIIEILNEKGKNLLSRFLKQPVWLQWVGYLTCLLLICLFYSGIQPFYYMRF